MAAACCGMPVSAGLSETKIQRFSLASIHCAACIKKIENCLNALKNVKSARVNLSMKRLHVTGSVEQDVIIQSLSEIGFDALPLNDTILEKENDKVGNDLLIRMAASGFAMMNIMILSVAVWSGASDETRNMFHLISAIIALPVIVYSSKPFFRNAYNAISVGRLNMDVPISLAIILSTLMSLFETLNDGQSVYFDAAISLTFFLLVGRYLDHKTRRTAKSAAKELTALEVQNTQRLEKGCFINVAVQDLLVGDLLLIPSGERIPVDGYLCDKSALLDRSLITGESNALEIKESSDLHAGEINLGHPLKMQVTTIGEFTSLRRMAALIETAENGRNSYTALADKAAQIYAPLVHLLALLAFIGWFINSGDIRHSINIAIAVLIITCPCALGLAVPAVTTAAISRLFSHGFLVKHATALERIAEVTHIVFDKTGTLTVPCIIVPESWSVKDKSVALALAQASGHPLSRALTKALTGVLPLDIYDLEEIQGEGVQAKLNGEQVKLGRGSWLDANFSGFGLKIGKNPAREIETSEELRNGVLSMLDEIDMPAEIITGDTYHAVKRFKHMVNLPITAQARPEDKIERLSKLLSQGKKTLMIGDGLNDTAALASAHAAIAPSTALEASRNAADIVVLDHDMKNIPLVVRLARATRKISKQNFAIAAIYNAVAIPIALAGFASPLIAALAMSASSITVILNSFRLRTIK